MASIAFTYAEMGRVYLAQASDELARGDLNQASEKAWGAAATMVKAVADVRGWNHGNHRVLFEAIDTLTAEIGDESVRTSFYAARQLHKNFYEGWLTAEAVTGQLGQVAVLVQRLEAVMSST